MRARSRPPRPTRRTGSWCPSHGHQRLLKESRARALQNRLAVIPWLALSIVAARAYGLDIIDGVYNDFKDDAGFREECESRPHTRHGRQDAHPPSQIEPCNEIFTPSAEEVAWAKTIIRAFDQTENANKGVIVVDGKMVERLHPRCRPSARSPSPTRSRRSRSGSISLFLRSGAKWEGVRGLGSCNGRSPTRNARLLRRRQTEDERLLWSRLRDRRLNGLKFRGKRRAVPTSLIFFAKPRSLLWNSTAQRAEPASLECGQLANAASQLTGL